MEQKDGYFSSLELINQEHEIVKFIVDMIQDGTLLEYPHGSENVTTVCTKRRKIEPIVTEILNKYDTTSKENPNKTSLVPKPTSSISNNMQRYKIINSSLTSMNLKFVEVTARVCPGGGKYKNVTSNRISSIDFGGTLQSLIDDKLITNLAEDLKRNHNVNLEDGNGTIAMYVSKHSTATCRLPCHQILFSKPELYHAECLSQRITLGSYYYPFLANLNEDEKQKDEDYPGILGNLLIRNNTIFGIGHSKIPIKNTDTFVDPILETECPDPVNAIISCSPHEVGVYAAKDNKSMILYLKSHDRVFYANKRVNEMKSARSVITDILEDNPIIKGKVRVECARQGKELPDDIDLDYSDADAVTAFVQKKFKRKHDDAEH